MHVSACGYVYVSLGSQEARGFRSLDLELQVVVATQNGTLSSLGRAARALNR